jgi:hypothetical protein
VLGRNRSLPVAARKPLPTSSGGLAAAKKAEIPSGNALEEMIAGKK